MKLFVHLHEVENPLLEVVKHANPHYMKKVTLWEVAQHTGNMSKHIEFSLDKARQEFSISCLAVSIAERSIKVEIPPGVLHVRRDIISNFVLWTLGLEPDIPLEMM